MDVNAIYLNDNEKKYEKAIKIDAADNLKRIILTDSNNWMDNKVENPYIITNFMETKTTWHPIEKNLSSVKGY